MGAYLSHPITKTEPEDGSGNGLEYGASSMQGWRVSQEDAHNCVPDFDTDSSFFAVYDGHGGSEVAVYLSQHLPEYLKTTKAYNSKDWKEALSEAYLKIDEAIKTPEVLKEIVRLSKFGKSAEDVDGQDEENVNELYEEATMPIELLVAKYKDGKSLLEKIVAAKIQESGEKPGSSKSFLKGIGSSETAAAAAGSSPVKTEVTSIAAEGSGDKEAEPELSSSSSSQPISSTNKSASQEVDSTSDGVKVSETDNKITCKDLEPDSPSEASLSAMEEHKLNGDISGTTTSKASDAVGVSNGLTSGNGETQPEVGEKEQKELESADSTSIEGEDSVVVVTESKKKKGKVHPPPVIQLPPKSSPEKRTSPRKNSEKTVYMDFLTGESTSEESDDDMDPAALKFQTNSDSEEDSGEAETGDTSDEEEDDDEQDDDDGECGEEDEHEDEDDEMLKDYQEPGYDSGATAVTAFTRWDGNKLHLWVANAGDSRCVVSRDGIALEMSQDHKPEDEREALRIVKAGGKVTNEGRVNGGLNLSRAIGDHSYKTNPTLPLQEQMITSLPDIEYAELNPETDKFIILACDGIWNSMTSQQVVDFVSARISNPDTKLSQICDELFQACLATDTGGDGTGCDNMSAIIVRINSREAAESKPETVSESKTMEVESGNDEDMVDSTVTENVASQKSTLSSLKRAHNGSPASPSTSEESKRLKLAEEEPV